MPDRYFIDEPISGEKAALTGPEAHHLTHVMRAKAGSEVVLFDGSGAEYVAQVGRVGKDRVELRIVSRREVDRELAQKVVLGVSLPKGDRQKWLVEKAVELGVARLTPLLTSRSVAQPVEAALVRLRRQVIEATKQCGRNRLLEIGEPLTWAEYVAAAPAEAARFVAHPRGAGAGGDRGTGGQGAGKADVMAGAERAGNWFAVGPEGGFTEEEIEMALQAGCALDLGPRILRVETAAVLLAAWCGT